MPFEKVRFGKEEIFKVEVQDASGREVDKWTVMKNDFWKVVKILNDKFGLDLKIIKKKKRNDLEWAM